MIRNHPIFDGVLFVGFHKQDTKGTGVMVGQNLKTLRMARCIKRMPLSVGLRGRMRTASLIVHQ
jgi:hypothetical protein